jgi:hypothetical protein
MNAQKYAIIFKMHHFYSTKHFTVLTQLPSSNEKEESLIQYDSIGHCSSLSQVNGNDLHAHGTEISGTQDKRVGDLGGFLCD